MKVMNSDMVVRVYVSCCSVHQLIGETKGGKTIEKKGRCMLSEEKLVNWINENVHGMGWSMRKEEAERGGALGTGNSSTNAQPHQRCRFRTAACVLLPRRREKWPPRVLSPSSHRGSPMASICLYSTSVRSDHLLINK